MWIEEPVVSFKEELAEVKIEVQDKPEIDKQLKDTQKHSPDSLKKAETNDSVGDLEHVDSPQSSNVSTFNITNLNKFLFKYAKSFVYWSIFGYPDHKFRF